MINRAVRTELSSPLSIHGRIRPFVRPIHLTRLPQGENRLDREGHARFTHADGFVLGIVRDPRRGVELGVDAMATPGSNDTAFSRLRMLFDDLAKLPYRRSRLHDLDGLVQAFSRRFNHSNRIWVGFGSVANVVGFVQIGVVPAVIQRNVEVEDIAVEEDPLIGNPMADNFVWRRAQ